MSMRIILVIALVGAASAGCGSSSASSGRIGVVASTNVYGDIVRQIGGGRVDVTSILHDPNADPHLFEASNQTALAVARARVVVQNGLGYDAWMTKLENASPSKSRTVVTIGDALAVNGSDANPHVWYDVARLPRIAAAVAQALAQADPKHAGAYRRNERRFLQSAAPLVHEVAAIRQRSAGTAIASTEPVAGYLTADAGLRDLSPASFTRAIESGSEPSPAAVADVGRLISAHRVAALLYNAQSVSPITKRVLSLANAAGVPVVPVSETLPAGTSYQQWLLGEARALEAALGS
jgi:zinc/manganese transport system substrate-binding protein